MIDDILDYIISHMYVLNYKATNVNSFHDGEIVKGQVISKCLFGVFNFFQKTNANKST